jgi:hypothetical protein
MNRIKTEKQTELINALKHVPQQKDSKYREHLSSLLNFHKDFRSEVEWNIINKNSYTFSVDYLYNLVEEFSSLYMIIDSSFEIELFPEMIKLSELTKPKGIKKNIDLHKFIYLKTILMLQNKEALITKKIHYKIPIVEKYETVLSKYILKEQNIMNIVEVGYSVYHTDVLGTRNGEDIHLYQLILDMGRFAGEEINNVKQRIEELKKRSNTHKYIDRMTVILKTM